MLIVVVAMAGCSASGSGDIQDLKEDQAVSDAVDLSERDGNPEVSQDSADGKGEFVPPFDWCLPSAPPDDACHASKRDPGSDLVALAKRIADKQLVRTSPQTLKWDWGEAVFMWSLMELNRVTREERYLQYARDWMDHHIDKGYSITTSDTCAPAAVAIRLFQVTKDPKYRTVGEDALKYLAEDAKRSPEGGISHLGTISVVTLWVDSLFMFGNVLLAWAEATGDPEALDLFAGQYRIFRDTMQDDNGFFRHTHLWLVEPDPHVYWGRGNGWVLAAAHQYLRIRTNRQEGDAEVAESAEQLLKAFQKTQDPESGLWWTLLDHPDFAYTETSVAALFAYGVARGFRYGFVEASDLAGMWKAIEGVLGRIQDDAFGNPVVTGVSGPTSADVGEEYAKIKTVDDVSFGLGSVILALVEVSGLPERPVAEPVEVPLEALSSYGERKSQYLNDCSEHAAPDSGSIYGQVCRVALGLPVSEQPIEEACQKLDDRLDCADFRAAALIRMLQLNDVSDSLPETVRRRIEGALLNFKYWLDQPGKDQMCFWSENHQILFHSAELLAGQRWPDDVFSNTGKTGAWHMEHAKPLIRRWMELRGRLGFSEWHSNVYFNEDIPALVNLADFAEDEDIANGARMLLDILGYDLLTNTYKGHFATVHGRTYDNKQVPNLSDSTREAAWIMMGLGFPKSKDNFGATFLATSTGYFPAPLLESMANASLEHFEHRQRDGIPVTDGPLYGISYEGLADFVVWCGMSAIGAPQVAPGTLAVVEEYDLWDGFLFGQLPADIKGLMKGLVGSPESIEQLSWELEVISRGIALEAMNTYTWRTPYYQLSGGQDYNPGLFGAQTHMWQATLADDVHVFTTFPSNMGDSGLGVEFATDWVGSWLPRVTLERNVGVIQYRRRVVPMLDQYLTSSYSHAFFPFAKMDEVREEGHWVLGRKDDSYVALYSRNIPYRAGDNDYEIRANGDSNVWIVELGSAAEQGSFDAFAKGILAASVSTQETIEYGSPSLGKVQVAWEGPMVVQGEEVDLGPFHRFRNQFGRTPIGSWVTVLEWEGHRMEYDFRAFTRKAFTTREP
jgi:unsaturated rhamnogalacturonyl hydrolase